MWLPKDERTLLALYTRKVTAAGETLEIGDEELVESLNLQTVNRLHDMKRDLHKKGLIECPNLGISTTVITLRGRYVPKKSDHPLIRMTEAGLKLGQKYNSLFGTFELRCKEHKIILGLVIAAMALLVGFIRLLVAILKN